MRSVDAVAIDDDGAPTGDAGDGRHRGGAAGLCDAGGDRGEVAVVPEDAEHPAERRVDVAVGEARRRSATSTASSNNGPTRTAVPAAVFTRISSESSWKRLHATIDVGEDALEDRAPNVETVGLRDDERGGRPERGEARGGEVGDHEPPELATWRCRVGCGGSVGGTNPRSSGGAGLTVAGTVPGSTIGGCVVVGPGTVSTAPVGV